MVGPRIRDVRTSQGMSLRALAADARLSPALLSQVERGLTSPSLETLRRLARSLDVPLFALFTEDPAQAAVVRAADRVLVRSPGGGVTYARISSGERLEVLEGRLQPGGCSAEEPWVHPAEECVLVVRGNLVVELAGERHVLADGDACTFNSRRPHRYVNEADEEVVFILSVTPPSF